MHALHVPRAQDAAGHRPWARVTTACRNPRDPRSLLFPQISVPGAGPDSASGANGAGNGERGGKRGSPCDRPRHDMPRRAARHARVLATVRSRKTAEGWGGPCGDTENGTPGQVPPCAHVPAQHVASLKHGGPGTGDLQRTHGRPPPLKRGAPCKSHLQSVHSSVFHREVTLLHHLDDLAYKQEAYDAVKGQPRLAPAERHASAGPRGKFQGRQPRRRPPTGRKRPTSSAKRHRQNEKC